MIRFLAKIAGQKMIGALPGGLGLYGGLQNHFTRSTNPSMVRVQQKVDIGLAYARNLEDLGGRGAIARGRHLDIGAGWHLTIPLLFWQLGCERQYLVDVREYARAPVVARVTRLLNACGTNEARRPLPAFGDLSLLEYLTLLGITYLAPVPGRYPLPDGSVSFATSTQVLLHPPREIVRQIFSEAARLLEPGGLFAATIHLYDLYADFDRRLSRFNYLRYTGSTWEKAFNGSLIAYNRLRASDYRRLFEGLPLVAERWDVSGPTREDLAELERIPLSADYSGYDVDDLASTHLSFVMRRT